MNALSTQFCGVAFENPFILPSGVYADTKAYIRAFEAGAAGVTFKSLTKLPRVGNPPPTVWKYDCGAINSVGLRNGGIDKGIVEIAEFMKANPAIPLIASIFSTNIQEFALLVEKVASVKPPFIELNLSCPNVKDELGESLGMQSGAAGKIVKEAKKYSGKIPLLAKLSPNVTNIADIAKSCEDAGADGIVAINSVGPGMSIDIKKRKPILGAKKGGVTGPGILPIAVKCVYEIYEAVRIPILGMGGVGKWQDVIEIVLAGASLVGVGTITYSKGMKVYKELGDEVAKYLKIEGIKNLSELVGKAHET